MPYMPKSLFVLTPALVQLVSVPLYHFPAGLLFFPLCLQHCCCSVSQVPDCLPSPFVYGVALILHATTCINVTTQPTGLMGARCAVAGNAMVMAGCWWCWLGAGGEAWTQEHIIRVAAP